LSAPEVATELVADVAEEVAEVATNVAEVSRGLAGRDLGLVFGGFVVGAGVGGGAAYYFLKGKLQTKYSMLAAEEISTMRQHYADKVVALEAQVGKKDLGELVREHGYRDDEDEEETPVRSSSPPMAVSPPAAVTEAAEAAAQDDGIEEPPQDGNMVDGDPVTDEPATRNIFRDQPKVEHEWDWAAEKAQRSPLRPYVIHREEREEQQAYDSVTYTYYEQDDVLCNERDEIIDETDREKIVGETNLERFGHGSDDPYIVYVRNNQLSMDIEVVRSPNSYAEEVHGLEPTIQHSDRRRDRRPFDDD
jgi:hypothetical protein